VFLRLLDPGVFNAVSVNSDLAAWNGPAELIFVQTRCIRSSAAWNLRGKLRAFCGKWPEKSKNRHGGKQGFYANFAN